MADGYAVVWSPSIILRLLDRLDLDDEEVAWLRRRDAEAFAARTGKRGFNRVNLTWDDIGKLAALLLIFGLWWRLMR